MQDTHVTIITGASSGIGRELARRAAREEHNLLLIARREERLAELKRELEGAHGIRVRTLPLDLAEQSAPQEVRDFISREGLTVEHLINNAAFGGHGLFHEQPLERNLEMIRLNNSSLVALTRHLLPGMIERGRGRILHVASTAGLLPGPLQAIYYATKAFVVSFSQAIAEELRGTGVTSTALCPGPVRTEFAQVANLEGAKLFNFAAEPQRVAEVGWKAMHRGKLLVSENRGMLFMLRYLVPLLPRSLALRISRKTQEKEQR
jgi:hypothetical protein